VYGVKSYLNALNEDKKSLKLRPSAQAQINAQIDKKRQEIHQLMTEMKATFSNIGRELKESLGELRTDLGVSKQSLQEVLGFEDAVKGFDLELVTDDNIDFLDIYAEFLGDEYFKMKEIY
jgi:hypothetical protein